MAVPKTGRFSMFGTGSIFTLEGAVSSSVVTYTDTDRFSGSAHLVGQSIDTKFDLDEVPGQVLLNNVNISESIQFRGYPIVDNFSMTLKCVYTSSFTKAGDTAPPADETVMCIEYLSGFFNGVRNGWVSGNINITGSGGFGDTSWPIDTSYDYTQISHRFDKLSIYLNRNGDTGDLPTFTSITIASPGKTDLVLDYCDLYSSSSLDDTALYNWNTTDPDDHFTSGNCITVSYDDTVVVYNVDCDPAITTSPVTITIGSIAALKQQSCDANTTSTVYMTPTDLTNGLTVGDYVYETSDGRNLFNGESKFWGINTSNAPTLNQVPDKIVQIASSGLITAISDCTQTPSYEPPLDPASRDCNSTAANPSGVIVNTNANYGAGEYDVHQIGSTSETTQTFLWRSYDRPNKFTLYDNSSTFANPIYSTGWVGNTIYTNAAGKDQWSVPLDTATSGSQTITWGSTTGRKVRVDYGSHPNLQDAAVFSLICASSLQPLNVATGNTVATACGGDYDDDIHYHFHTTGSGDFNESYQPQPYSVSGTHVTNRGRVFENTSGLPVGKDLTKWISYSSSEGTKYRYMVIDDYQYHMGNIAYHQKCPGTEIAVVRLTDTADCDDSNSTFLNNSYISSNFGGFDAVGGVLKIDNDNLSLSNRTNNTLYNSDDSINYDPQQIVHNISHDVDADSTTDTYLVHTDSLKNPTGTKLLATVTAGSPAQIKFTPCVVASGGCTEFEASSYFESSDFPGSDPTGYKCGLPTTDQIWIDLSGNEPEVGDGVYSTDDCSSYIDESDVYFTIYNSILDKTWVILMDSDGELIDSIWECTSEDVGNSGDNTYYISTGYTDMGDHCGGSPTSVSSTVTIDANNTSVAINNIVYQNGARFNGGGKYYIVSDSSTSTNGLGGDSYKFWKISSTGVVTEVNDFTCPLDKLTTEMISGCVISLGADDNDVEFYEVEFNHEDANVFDIVYADITPNDVFPAGSTFHMIPETSFAGRVEFDTINFSDSSERKSFEAVNNGDEGRIILQLKDSNGVIRGIGEMNVYIVDEGNNDC